jgi:GNAT superfamily N-acetyltransferase
LIRWRQPGDDPGIVELVRTQLLPLSPRNTFRSGQLRQDISTRLGRGATMVVPRAGNSDPLAFLHLEVRKTTLFVDLLAVEPSAQNRHWGTELMNRAEQYGISQGCTEARLFVDDTNLRGLRFYGKLGYFAVRHIRDAGCYELFKTLAPSWR